MTPAEVKRLFAYLTPREREEVFGILEGDPAIWRPLPGPQTMAYFSQADVIGFGGAAGGGKTDLACGKALTQHEKSMLLRREGTQLTGIIDRFTELLKGRNGYNGQDKIWRLPGRQLEFGSTPNLGNELRYQGRPHDFLVFDEATNFLEKMVRFLLGWLRTTTPGQRCQALLTFNPPTNAEGRWVIPFFAPWLDPKYPSPALPGEIRHCATLPDGQGGSRDLWVDNAEPFVFRKEQRIYDFDPADFEPDEIITPLGRTFIPSRIRDNPHLLGTGYMSQLQALPEPLRSQMLKGDFQAGMSDDAYQLIPTAWVEAAQARWKPREQHTEMLSMGVDVARGGKDRTTIARRHTDWWFDTPISYPGKETPDGPDVAGKVISASRDEAPIHIDIIGVGASPFDFLKQLRQPVYGINVGEKANATDKSGRLTFSNLRSQYLWQFRELLDPANGHGVALPPDPDLLREMCAFTWSVRGMVIYALSRDELVAKIGVSPDKATAYVLAAIDTPKLRRLQGALGDGSKPYDPYANLN